MLRIVNPRTKLTVAEFPEVTEPSRQVSRAVARTIRERTPRCTAAQAASLGDRVEDAIRTTGRATCGRWEVILSTHITPVLV